MNLSEVKTAIQRELVRRGHHIDVDGIDSPQTWGAIYSELHGNEVEIEQTEAIIGTIAGVNIYRKSTSIHFTAGLMIDADGSPHAYHPRGSPPGLDYLANAGKPGNWWGVATDENGNPYVQVAADPAPGFYVSTTALERTEYQKFDPRRYVDSEIEPFFVLPSKFPAKIKLGTKGTITNTENGKTIPAIYADIGPAAKIGEGSIALAEALGIPSNPKTGGTEKKIIRYEFPV